MKKKTIVLLTTIAMLSIATAGVGKAYAYFTTYVQAAGSHTIELGDITEIEEKVSGNKKTVSIQNKSESKQAVFVRVRAYSGSDLELIYETDGTAWTQPGDDGWAYYMEAVEPGEKTETIEIKIEGIPRVDEADQEQYNVVVVYESTPAVQDGVGKYVPADKSWTPLVEGGENS